MRKLLLSCSFLLLTALSACVSKSERLSSDTLTIAIDPSTPQTVAVGGQIALKAVCRSAKSDNVDVNPSWSVENSLGSFSAAAGKTTTFTAGAAGTGNIYASYQGIRGALSLTVGSGGGGSSGYTLLADAGASTDLKSVSGSIMQYFDGGDGSVDGPPWTITVLDDAPGCSVDSTKCAKVIYTNGAGYWGGFFLEFNTARNMSAYSKLTFYVKSDGPNVKFIIKIKDSSNIERQVFSTSYVTTTASWQKVEIPLSAFSGVNTASLSIPFVLAFTDGDTLGSATIYLDYIKYE